MVRRVLDIDGDHAEAGEILGTPTVDEAVHRALEEVVRNDQRRRHVRRLRSIDALDLDDPVVMLAAWR